MTGTNAVVAWLTEKRIVRERFGEHLLPLSRYQANWDIAVSGTCHGSTMALMVTSMASMVASMASMASMVASRGFGGCCDGLDGFDDSAVGVVESDGTLKYEGVLTVALEMASVVTAWMAPMTPLMTSMAPIASLASMVASMDLLVVLLASMASMVASLVWLRLMTEPKTDGKRDDGLIQKICLRTS